MFKVLLLLPDLGKDREVAVPLFHVLRQAAYLGPDRPHVEHGECG